MPLILKDPIYQLESTQRKFVVYVKGTFMSINFPPRNWKGYYAYSSRIGGKLCLLVGGKNPLTIEE